MKWEKICQSRPKLAMFVYSYDKFRFLGNSLKDIAKYGFLINVGYNDNNLTCQKKKKKSISC